MKKSTLPMISILIVVFGMFCAVQDAFAVDPPHNGRNSLNMTMSCTACHYDTAGPTPSWATQPTTTDETFFNNLCTSCHLPSRMTDSRYVVKTHSSQNSSGNYGNWTVECRRCHNPHLQDQVSSYPTDTTAVLAGGTIVSYSQVPVSSPSSTILVSPGLTPNAWIDFILVPNVLYPTRMYHIRSNTADSITVSGAIDGRYARTGNTYAIRTATMVSSRVQTPYNGLATVKYFTNDSSRPNSYASSTDPNNVTGICQVCHTRTKSFNRTNVTGSIQEGIGHPTVGAQACTGCHIHTQGFKGECNACHGYPPSSTATLIFRDSTGATVTSDSGAGPGAHVKHVASVGLVCANCHANGMLSGATAGDNAINIGFNWNSDTSGSYVGNTGRSVYPLAGTAVTPGLTYQCSNLYCHSSGQGSTSMNPTPVYASPSPAWNNPAGGACGACHGVITPLISTGSHTKHLAADTNCGNCHTGASASAYSSASHVNRLIDVSNNYTAQGAPGNGYGTCSTAACHGASSPIWGNNTNNNTCTTCHGTGAATVDGTNRYVVAPPLSVSRNTGSLTGTGQVSNDAKVGAHQTHLRLFNGLTGSAVQTLDERCRNCHGTLPTSGTHADGTSAPTWTGLATRSGAMSPSYAGVTCTNTYCHNPAGTGGTLNSANTGSATTPAWTNAAYIADGALKTTANCGVCHKNPWDGGFTSSYNHGVMTTATICSGCHGHDGNALGVVGQRHMDGARYGAGGTCDACHDYDVDPVTGDWGKSQYAVEGWGAHAAHISHLKAVSGVTLSATGDNFNTANFNAVCGVCHTTQSSNHAMGGSPLRSINFGDGSLAYRFSSSGTPTYTGVAGVSSATTLKICSNVSCHFQASPVWEGL